MHTLGIQVLAFRQIKQRLQHFGALGRGLGLAGYAKAIASIGDIDTEAPFDLPQVFIKLAAEIGEAAVVGGLENDVPRNLDSIQSLYL